MLKNLIIAVLALLLGPLTTLAQSETFVRQGGGIYDGTTGSYLGNINLLTGKEETLASTIASGLSATSVVCTNASKVLTSTCTAATPSFGATTLDSLAVTAATTMGSSLTLTASGAALGIKLIGRASDDVTNFLWYKNDGTTLIGGLAATTAGNVQITAGSTTGLQISNVASANRYPVLAGSNGGSPTLSASAGSIALAGSATNDAASAGYVGELLTVTVASGAAVSLTTATSANIATLSVTAGDWDCSAQVTHNAAATTSITLLQIGISATTATLPTQAGGSGIGTDPLAIFRTPAAVPAGALTTNVGPVRVSLSGTTNIFLVANDTFTVSTMTGYGTLRCRRAR